MLKFNLKKSIVFVSLIVIMIFTLTGCSKDKLPENLDKITSETAQYVLENATNPTISSVGGDWAVKGIVDSKIDVEQEYFDSYYDNVRAIVKSKKGILSTDKLTEYARVSIGLKSIGKDARNVEGYDLIKALDNYPVIIEQGSNAVAYALIASNLYDIQLENEEKYIDYLLSALSSGQFGESEDEYQVDYIAMIIEGLSFYRNQEKVNQSVDAMVKKLSDFQEDDGSFGNCESTAEVICALSQIGIDVLTDERFNKNGKTPGDALMEYRMDDGGFLHEKSDEYSDLMASEKGLMALNAMRLCRDKQPLY